MITNVLCLFLVGLFVRLDAGICPAATWLPEGSDYTCTNGVDYDGSRIPDCARDEGTTYLHLHEYGEILNKSLISICTPDCGLFWECGPLGACLMECPPCFTHPITCPLGKLEFDCRFTVPDNVLQ